MKDIVLSDGWYKIFPFNDEIPSENHDKIYYIYVKDNERSRVAAYLDNSSKRIFVIGNSAFSLYKNYHKATPEEINPWVPEEWKITKYYEIY